MFKIERFKCMTYLKSEKINFHCNSNKLIIIESNSYSNFSPLKLRSKSLKILKKFFGKQKNIFDFALKNWLIETSI